MYLVGLTEIGATPANLCGKTTFNAIGSMAPRISFNGQAGLVDAVAPPVAVPSALVTGYPYIWIT